MIQAVLFDFDGVIVHSEPCHYQTLVELLRPYGVSFSWESYVKRYLGIPDRPCIQAMLEDQGVHVNCDEIDTLVGKKSALFKQFLLGDDILVAGIRELLHGLCLGQIPTAICSGALYDEIRLVLEIHGLDQYFPVIVSVEDVSRGKPAPDGFLLAVERLNGTLLGGDAIKASHCLVIEDSVKGVQAARAAGMRCVAITTSYPAEQFGQADRIINGLGELNPDALL